MVDCVFEFVRTTEYEMQFTDPIVRREEDDEDASEQKGNATADESGNKKQTKSRGGQGVREGSVIYSSLLLLQAELVVLPC